MSTMGVELLLGNSRLNRYTLEIAFGELYECCC